MTRFKSLYTLSLVLPTVVALSSCASMTDTPNQQIQVLTPGAEGAKCTISTDYAKYITNPPETFFIRRMQEPLKIHCVAPGNRERTTFAYPKRNGAAFGNIITGGVSAFYDHFSGALYEYPSPITVDFRHTIATKRPLPAYYSPDTISPLDQKPAGTLGVPTHPTFGNDPAALIEKETDKLDEKEATGSDPALNDSEKSSETPLSSNSSQK